jgi:hypothetical protein
MNIDVSDELIEKIARDLIKERVKQFFNTETNKNFIRNAINSEVKRIVEVELRDRRIDIEKMAKSYAEQKLFECIAGQISRDIAEAYSEKYGSDY